MDGEGSKKGEVKSSFDFVIPMSTGQKLKFWKRIVNSEILNKQKKPTENSPS